MRYEVLVEIPKPMRSVDIRRKLRLMFDLANIPRAWVFDFKKLIADGNLGIKMSGQWTEWIDGDEYSDDIIDTRGKIVPVLRLGAKYATLDLGDDEPHRAVQPHLCKENWFCSICLVWTEEE